MRSKRTTRPGALRRRLLAVAAAAVASAAGAQTGAQSGAQSGAQPSAETGAKTATATASADSPTAAKAAADQPPALQLPDLRELKIGVPRQVQAASAMLGMGRQRLALVLGLSTVGASAVVDNAPRDVQAVAKVLRDAGFVVMVREDLLGADLRATLKEFNTRLQPGGIGFVYASGLGAQLDGKNVLLPRDAALDTSLSPSARQAQWRDKAVPLAEVVDALMGPVGSPRLLVVDAAYQHPALADLPAKGLAEQRLPPGLIALFSHAPGTLQEVPAVAALPSPPPTDPKDIAASRFARTLVAQLGAPRARGPDALRATRRVLVDGSLGQIEPWLAGDTDGEEVAEASLVDGLLPRTPEDLAREAARQVARTMTRPAVSVASATSAAGTAVTAAPPVTALPAAPGTVAAAAAGSGEQPVNEVLDQAGKSKPNAVRNPPAETSNPSADPLKPGSLQPATGNAAPATAGNLASTTSAASAASTAAATSGAGSALGAAASAVGTAASVAGTVATAAVVAKAVETAAVAAVASTALSTAGSIAGNAMALATRGAAAAEPQAAAATSTAAAAASAGNAKALSAARAGAAAADAAAAPAATSAATSAAGAVAAPAGARAVAASTIPQVTATVAATTAAGAGDLPVDAINAAAPPRPPAPPRMAEARAAQPSAPAVPTPAALRVNPYGYGEGDVYTYRTIDTWKGQVKGTSTTAIEQVLDDGRLLGNGQQLQLDPQGRVLRQANEDGTVSLFEPRQELWWSNPKRGESRDLRFKETLLRGEGRGAGQRGEVEWKGEASVGKPTKVQTPAGEFDVLPIESSGWQYARRSDGTRADSKWSRTVWYSPRLGHPVAIDIEDTDHLGRLLRRERVELLQAQSARRSQ